MLQYKDPRIRLASRDTAIAEINMKSKVRNSSTSTRLSAQKKGLNIFYCIMICKGFECKFEQPNKLCSKILGWVQTGI